MRFTDSLVLPLSDRQDSNLRATVPKTVEINLTPLLPVIRSPPRIRTSILWTKTICPAVRRGENLLFPICQRSFSFEPSIGFEPTT